MKRRHSKLRSLERGNPVLPPMGWVVTHPNDPPSDCSWCAAPLRVLPSGVVFCPPCDQLPRRHTPGPAEVLA